MSETVRKQVDGEPAKVGPRKFRWVVSTEDVDRDRDVIYANGWDLTAFRRNSVIQFAHDYSTPPIGRAVSIEVRSKRLEAVIEFAPPGLHPLADTCCGLVEAGFLRACSVGFRPKRFTKNAERDGLDFFEAELLEISVVPVPANASALLVGRSVDTARVKSWLAGQDEPVLYLDDDLVLLIDEEPTITCEQIAEAWGPAMQSVRRELAADPLGDPHARHKADVAATMRAMMPGLVR